MRAFELAECIARDATCAQGEFNQRVLAIIPYLTGPLDEIERLRAYQNETALAWTKLTESQEDEIEQLRAALAKLADPLLIKSEGVGTARALHTIATMREIAREALEQKGP